MERYPRALRNRAPGVELERDIRSTDQGEKRPARAQRCFELTPRLLSRADDDRIRRDQLELPVDFDVQSRVVDTNPCSRW